MLGSLAIGCNWPPSELLNIPLDELDWWLDSINRARENLQDVASE